MSVNSDPAVVEHVVAAVVGVGAVANGFADHIAVVCLQIEVTVGAVGGQGRPGVGQNLGVIEIGPGIAHGEVSAAVAAQLQARGRLHHAGGDPRHIALGNLAALGIQNAVADDQGAVAGDNGAGADDAVGGNVYIVHFTFCGIVYHDGGAVAGKVINAVADHVEGGILDGIDRIAANI